MKIGFLIYNGMTALDFIGVYDPITRLKTMGFLPDLEWEIHSDTGEVSDSTGLRFTPTRVSAPLGENDVIVVPGGWGSRRLTEDAGFIEWLRSAASCRLKVSVCTGALLLGAAGFLKGKRATTHPAALPLLERWGVLAVGERIVEEGDCLTAGGVTASIDLGLYLCEKWAGRAAKEQIGRQMDYRALQ